MKQLVPGWRRDSSFRNSTMTGLLGNSQIAPGQKVTIQDPATLKWKPAEVEERLTVVPCSYMVRTPAGRKLRSTRTHILEVTQSNQEVKPDLGGQTVSCAPSSAANNIQDIPGTRVLTGPGSYLTQSRRVVKPSRDWTCNL